MWWFFLAACTSKGTLQLDGKSNASDADADTDTDTDADSGVAIDTASFGPQPEDPVLADSRYAALFDPTILHTVALDLTDANFALLQANGLVAVPCKATIDGEPVPYALSVKLGGEGAQFGWLVKAKLHLDFDDYVPGQTWAGMEKLTLDDLAGDVAMSNGVLASQVLIANAQPAARASFATVTVQGVPAGLYALDEVIDHRWLSRWFADSSGTLWECKDGCDFTEDSVGAWSGAGDRTALDAVQSLVQTDFYDFYPQLGGLVSTDAWLGEWGWLAVLGHDNSWPYDLKNAWAYADPAQSGRLVFIADSVDQAWNPLTGYDHVVSALAARCLYDPLCDADLIPAVRIRADAYDAMDVPALAQAAFDLTADALASDPIRNANAVNTARAALKVQIGAQTAQVRGELPW